MRREWLWVLASLLGASACGSLGEGCTAMGCIDGASVELRPAGGDWEQGAYALSVIVEGSTHACTFSLPQDVPQQGTLHELACEPALGFPGAQLAQEAECHEQRDGDSVSQSCVPVPDRYALRLELVGTPQSAGIQLTRDGADLLQQTADLTYTETRPNGPRCEPVCHRTSVVLTF